VVVTYRREIFPVSHGGRATVPGLNKPSSVKVAVEVPQHLHVSMAQICAYQVGEHWVACWSPHFSREDWAELALDVNTFQYSLLTNYRCFRIKNGTVNHFPRHQIQPPVRVWNKGMFKWKPIMINEAVNGGQAAFRIPVEASAPSKWLAQVLNRKICEGPGYSLVFPAANAHAFWQTLVQPVVQAMLYPRLHNRKIVHLKSGATGRNLRVQQGTFVTGDGGVGQFAKFIVHRLGPNVLKFESVAFPGRFVNIRAQGNLGTGIGGRFCEFLICPVQPPTFAFQSQALTNAYMGILPSGQPKNGFNTQLGPHGQFTVIPAFN